MDSGLLVSCSCSTQNKCVILNNKKLNLLLIHKIKYNRKTTDNAL